MIETEDVVERVARALAAVASRHGTLCEGEQPEDNWEAWEEEARAALSATPIERLREENARRGEALDDLQQAEAEYRLMHDRHGDGSQAAGRAWDLMRRAGDKARAALNQQ